MASKLSERAIELLTMIDARTTWEGDERPGRVLTCYFVPKYGGREPSGSGDVAILKSLERKGYVKAQRLHFSYSITEDGIAVLAAAE